MNGEEEARERDNQERGVNEERQHSSGIHNNKTSSGQGYEPPRRGPDLVSVATIGLAVSTFILACVTTWMAFETRRIAEAAEDQSHDVKTSLELTQNQLGIAQKQLNAALDYNRIAQDSLTLTTRPSIQAAIISANRTDGGQEVFTFKYQNVGNGPALDVVAAVNQLTYIDAPGSVQPQIPALSRGEGNALFSKDAGAPLQIAIQPAPTTMRRAPRIEIFGRVEYKDQQLKTYHRYVCIVDSNFSVDTSLCPEKDRNSGD